MICLNRVVMLRSHHYSACNNSNNNNNNSTQNISTQNNDEILTSRRGLGILYITLLAENCENLKMAAIGRNM